MTQTFIPVFKVLPNPNIGAAVQAVYDTGYIGQGDKVEEFEQAFGELVGAPEPPLSVNSGTAALDLALWLIGVGQGDEVISTEQTCTATNSVIALRGARIIWADIDPLTGNIDPTDVARKVTKRTKAIMAVDWAGRAVDYRALRGLDNGRGCGPLPIIQDAAHAFLATYQGEPFAAPGPDDTGYGDYEYVGGDYIAWSLQAIKHCTSGDGGMLLPPQRQIERGRKLRWYGLDRRSSADFRCSQDITEIGTKLHMNDIAATIGLSNLDGAVRSVAASRANAEYYCHWLKDTPGIDVAPYDPGCSYWLFTILVDDRDDFTAHLASRGIGTSMAHARNGKHTAFKEVSETRGPLPGQEAFDRRQIAIPCGFWVSEAQREYIAATIVEWAMQRARRAA
jgi:dTDP-4-amino-4,6-dideoxygalactose transaminase